MCSCYTSSADVTRINPPSPTTHLPLAIALENKPDSYKELPQKGGSLHCLRAYNSQRIHFSPTHGSEPGLITALSIEYREFHVMGGLLKQCTAHFTSLPVPQSHLVTMERPLLCCHGDGWKCPVLPCYHEEVFTLLPWRQLAVISRVIVATCMQQTLLPWRVHKYHRQ